MSDPLSPGPVTAAGPALVLAPGLYRTPYAKTAHGLVRHGGRWPVAAVIDPDCPGEDAGTLLDGRPRGIPMIGSVRKALRDLETRPEVAVVGVATAGGMVPAALRNELMDAATAGLTLVNGLHVALADDDLLAATARRAGGSIIDIRRPRATAHLRFWTGEVLALAVPRVAVLGTDCAVGKRTTCRGVVEALRAAGTGAEMIYTGQTGWLQGLRHGFILDATPNDFVPGELEGAILACAAETRAAVILLEGQAALRNPSGPCGSELVISAGATGVILQHAPARRFFEGLEDLECVIPPLADEVRLIELLGASVWAVALNEDGIEPTRRADLREALERKLRLPVVSPLREGFERLAEVVRRHIADRTKDESTRGTLKSRVPPGSAEPATEEPS